MPAPETTGLISNLAVQGDVTAENLIGNALTLAGDITIDADNVTITGDLAFTGDVTTDRGVTDGTALAVGGLAYGSIAASTAVTATASETPFDTNYNMPANMLKPGTVVRIRYQGIATATNASDTLQIHLRIGGSTSNATGTALITSAATDATNNDIFTGEFFLTCRTDGATGTLVGFGSFSEVGAAGAALKNAYLASTAVDTTGALPIKVTALWSSNNAGNSCRLDVLNVEILG